MTLFVASVANLKSPSPLALDDDMAVLQAQLDLTDVTASGIDLFRDQSRALQAAASFALRDVAASVNADGRGFGIASGCAGAAHRRRIAR
jgi:hypothetical protein